MLTVQPALAATSEEWRIHVRHNAQSDGVVALQLRPRGGYPFEIRVTVTEWTKENDIARRIRDVLEAELPRDAHEVDVDDGEEVTIEARKGTGEFNVALLDSTVTGVEFEVERK